MNEWIKIIQVNGCWLAIDKMLNLRGRLIVHAGGQVACSDKIVNEDKIVRGF